jgi:3-mercaptopyruvate sulfurtransferase SseA
MARRFLLASVMLAVIAISSQCATSQEQKMKQPERIAISDLKKKLDSGEKLLLIDVREDWELKQDGAIPGAIHIPVSDLDKRMKDIPKDVDLLFY